MNYFNRSITATVLAALAATSSMADESMAAREQAAKAVSSAFMLKLGGELKTHLSASGPVEAIKVCRDIAPSIANELSIEHGWRVTRVGTRVRNPMLGIPDAREQAVLSEFKARHDGGESFDDMTHTEVVTEGTRRYLRFMKPIGVKQVCLACHGSAAEIPSAVQTILEQQYPHDRATGYQVGELRGAISIKQPLD